MPELKRLMALLISNETVSLGEPVDPLLVAERLVVDDGQNQPAKGPVHAVRTLGGAGKYNPFEPLSMKLWLYVVPLNTVVNSPVELALNVVTPEGELFAWVPIPSTRLPLTEVVPPEETLGSCRITPLLSTGSRATGFWT